MIDRRFVTLVLAGGFGLGTLFAVGYYPRWQRAHAQVQAAPTPTVPVVNVVSPEVGTQNGELVLPGELKAVRETAVYARTTGYLKRRLVDIGDRVRAGQLLAVIESPELDKDLGAAKAQLMQARANQSQLKSDLAMAKTTFERWQTLQKEGHVARQEADEKGAAYRAKQAQLQASDAAVLAAATNVQRLTTLTGFEKVTAPFAGAIAARYVDNGALITPNSVTGLFRLVDGNRLRMSVSVPQIDMDGISLGQSATISVRNHAKPYAAKVARIAGALDSATRTLAIEVELPNPAGKLKPGMYAEARLASSRTASNLTVPGTTVVTRAAGTLVAVVDKTQHVHFQKIVTGRDDGAKIEVFEGLKGDERIIVNPGDEVKEGAIVQAVAAPTETNK